MKQKQITKTKQNPKPQIPKNNVTDKSKKNSDLGRPKKPSKQLRDQELKIKQMSINQSEFELILYLHYGGIETLNRKISNQVCFSVIGEYFGSYQKQQFLEMLKDREEKLKEIEDPINQETVSLSSEYFLVKYLTKDSKKISLKLFFTIFIFQIFVRSDENGFQQILSNLVQILNLASQQKNENIIKFINHENILPLISADNKFQELYKYLFFQMETLKNQHQIELVNE